jgi:hypothetical protein
MGSQLDPLPLSRVGSWEHASKSQLSATWLCGTLKWVSPHDLGARQCPSNGKLGSRLEVGTIFIGLIYNMKKEDKNNV